MPVILSRVALAAAATFMWAPLARAADVKDECARAAEAAQPLMLSGKLALARPALVSCARAECPPIVRVDCAQWLVSLDKMTPSIVVRAHDARGRDLIAVRVTVDSRVVAEHLDGSALPIDPGAHQLRYEVTGAPAIEERLLIAQGEKNRVLSPSFRGALKADGSRDEVLAAATSPSPSPPGERPRLPAAFYASGALGVLALGAFAALEVSAQHDKSNLDAGCGQTGTCGAGEVDSVRNKFVAAGVSLGVGVVSLGVAAVLALVNAKVFAPATTGAAAQVGTLVRF